MERDWFAESEAEVETDREDFIRERIAIGVVDGKLDDWDAQLLALECWMRYIETHGKQGRERGA